MSFWVAGAVVVGSAITSQATAGAADSQAQSSADATGENRRQFNVIQANQKPYLETGAKALGALASENDTPFDASRLQMDPGYQFGLTQGQQAIDRQTAAAGGRISGSALKAAAQFGNDYATKNYDTAYNRANQARADRLNRLAALAGIGQTATQQVSDAGMTTAANIGNIMTAQGNATGAAQLAQGNIWSGAGNQLAALYGRNTGFTPNAGGTGINPYAGFDAGAAGGWGIE